MAIRAPKTPPQPLSKEQLRDPNMPVASSLVQRRVLGRQVEVRVRTSVDKVSGGFQIAGASGDCESWGDGVCRDGCGELGDVGGEGVEELQGCVAVAIEYGVETGGVQASCGVECVDHVGMIDGKFKDVSWEAVAEKSCIYQQESPYMEMIDRDAERKEKLKALFLSSKKYETQTFSISLPRMIIATKTRPASNY